MRIFAGHDGGSACCWYRMTLPLRELEARGHHVTWRSAGDEAGNTPVTLAEMAGHDIIIGQRFNAYRGLGSWRRARTPLTRLVYETDDDIFTVSPDNYAAWRVFSDPVTAEAIRHMAETADLITVTTGHLAGVMRERAGNPNVAVLPNCVPGWLLDTEPPSWHGGGPGGRRLAIGYGGGASHGWDVGLIASSVRRFLKRFPDWDLRLLGTDFRPTFRAPADRVRHSGWVRVNDDPAGYYGLLDFDIGLAPLAMREFDWSKSGIKVLEYAARGIPPVATDCPAYRELITHGETGFLVKADHEWLKYMSVLAADGDLRMRMGDAARAGARDWTIGRTAALWETAYHSLFTRGALSR